MNRIRSLVVLLVFFISGYFLGAFEVRIAQAPDFVGSEYEYYKVGPESNLGRTLTIQWDKQPDWDAGFLFLAYDIYVNGTKVGTNWRSDKTSINISLSGRSNRVEIEVKAHYVALVFHRFVSGSKTILTDGDRPGILSADIFNSIETDNYIFSNNMELPLNISARDHIISRGGTIYAPSTITRIDFFLYNENETTLLSNHHQVELGSNPISLSYYMTPSEFIFPLLGVEQSEIEGQASKLRVMVTDGVGHVRTRDLSKPLVLDLSGPDTISPDDVYFKRDSLNPAVILLRVNHSIVSDLPTSIKVGTQMYFAQVVQISSNGEISRLGKQEVIYSESLNSGTVEQILPVSLILQSDNTIPILNLDTEYFIELYAVDRLGNEGERTYHSFTTPPDILRVSEILPENPRIENGDLVYPVGIEFLGDASQLGHPTVYQFGVEFLDEAGNSIEEFIVPNEPGLTDQAFSEFLLSSLNPLVKPHMPIGVRLKTYYNSVDFDADDYIPADVYLANFSPEFEMTISGADFSYSGSLDGDSLSFYINDPDVVAEISLLGKSGNVDLESDSLEYNVQLSFNGSTFAFPGTNQSVPLETPLSLINSFASGTGEYQFSGINIFESYMKEGSSELIPEGMQNLALSQPITIVYDTVAPTIDSIKLAKNIGLGYEYLDALLQTNDTQVYITELIANDSLSGLGAIYIFNDDTGFSYANATDIEGVSFTEMNLGSADSNGVYDFSSYSSVRISIPESGIAANHAIVWSLSDIEGASTPGSYRRVIVGIADKSGNIQFAALETVVDTIPPAAVQSIAGMTFEEQGASSLTTLSWEAVNDAARYGIDIVYPDSSTDYLNVAVTELAASTVGLFGPDEAIQFTISAFDAAGNMSEPVIYTAFTPMSAITIQNLQITGVGGQRSIELDSPILDSNYEIRRYSETGSLEGLNTVDGSLGKLVLDSIAPRSIYQLSISALGSAPSFTDVNGLEIPGDWYKTPNRAQVDFSSGLPVHDSSEAVLSSASVDGESRLVIEILNSLPSEPQILSPMSFASDDVVFSWAASEDFDGDAIHYFVYLSEDGAVEQQLEFYTEVGGPVDFLETENFAVQDIANLSSILSLGNFQHDLTYSWRVVAVDMFADSEGAPAVPHSFISSAISDFTFDSEAPSIFIADNILNPTVGADYFTSDLTLTIEVSDSGSGIEEMNGEKILFYSWDSSSYDQVLTLVSTGIDGDGNELFEGEVQLPLGEHTFYYQVRDVSGLEAEDSFIIRADRSAPSIDQIFPGLNQFDGKYVSPFGSFTIDATLTDDYAGIHSLSYGFVDAPGQIPPALAEVTFNAFVDPAGVIGSEVRNGLGIDWLPAGDGEKFLAVKAKDWAGNETADFLYVEPSILVDRTFPEVQVTLSGTELRNGLHYVSNSADFDILVDTTEIIGFAASEAGTTAVWFENIEELRSSGLFLDGATLELEIKVQNSVGAERIIPAGIIIFDSSAPQIIDITIQPQGAVASGALISTIIEAIDSHTGVESLQLALGSAMGEADISAQVNGNSSGWLAIDANGSLRFRLPDYEGPVYFTVRAENAAGLEEVRQEPSAALTASIGTRSLLVFDQGPFSANSGSLDFSYEYLGPADVVTWQYRIRENGSAGPWTTFNSPDGNVSIAGTYQNGVPYIVEVRGLNSESIQIIAAASAGIRLDGTAPIFDTVEGLTVPYAHGTSELPVSWKVSDPESSLFKAEYSILESDGLGGFTPLSNWASVIGASDLTNGRNELLTLPLGLQSGDKIYVALRIINSAGLSVERVSQAVTIDNSAPELPVVIDQGDYINTKYAPIANWLWSPGDNETPVTYEWTFVQNLNDLFDAQWISDDGSMIADTSLHPSLFTAGDHHHGERWFFAVRVTDSAGNYVIGNSDGLYFDSTAPLLAEVTLEQSGLPAPQFILSLGSLSLRIDADEDIGAIEEFIAQRGFWNGLGAFEAQGVQVQGVENILSFPAFSEVSGAIIAARGDVINNAALSAYGYSIGTQFDDVDPEVSNIQAAVSGNWLIFDWDGFDADSGIEYFEVSVQAASASAPDSQDWLNTGQLSRYEVSLADLPSDTTDFRLFVRAVDKAGNSSSVQDGISRTIGIDLEAPSITNLNYMSYTSQFVSFDVFANDNSGIISEYQYALGTFENPTAFTGIWESILSSEAVLSRTITYASLGVMEPLHGSKVYLRVRVKDSAGNWSPVSGSDAIAVDRTAPVNTAITKGPYNRSLTEIFGVEAQSLDQESTVQFYRLQVLEDIVGVTELSSDVLPASQLSDFTLQNFTFIVPSLNEGGIYHLGFQTQNGAGDWSEVVFTDSFEIDTIEPVLTFLSDSEELVVNDLPYLVWFELSEDIAEGAIYLVAPNGDSIQADISGLQIGTHMIEFTETVFGSYIYSADITDAAGNEGNRPADGLSESRQRIRLNAPPIVELPLFYTTPGKPFVFSASSVEDPDGDEPFSYNWQFHDATGNGFLENPVKPYFHTQITDLETRYPIILTVTDSEGKSTTVSSEVVVLNTTNGQLYTDEYWQGNYSIDGQIIVPTGITLTIASDTEVIITQNDVNSFDYGITVSGSLIHEGPVHFFRETGYEDFWQGILIYGDAAIDNIEIENARRAITAANTSIGLLIQDGIFRNNLIGLHAVGSELTVFGCLIENSGAYAIKEDADPWVRVVNSLFYGNLYDYYDDIETIISLTELNARDGNTGNSGDKE
jgi:hypothetical protein